MVRRVLLAVAIVILTAGCGGSDEATTTDSTSTGPAALTAPVRVYWLRDGKVWPAARDAETPGIAGATAAQLLEGPTEQEESELGFATAIPKEAETLQVSIDDGVAQIELDAKLSSEALAQLVYTLTQFPTVESVEIDAEVYTRSDFEDLTPAILVESPLPFEDVTSPLRVTGTANTFEANFQYELTDTDGLIIAEDFVTATSGTGTRGTFEFTVPFTIKFDGVGSLVVFEPSAKDGSRTNLVEIPIRMTQ